MSPLKKVLEFAHQLLDDAITKDDVVVDMTAGNGSDTSFLCLRAKHVYAFDIQEEALKKTKEKTKGHDNITLINDNHCYICKYIHEEIKAAIFNLGYLPGGDKTITTTVATTLCALKQVLGILQPKGLCIIVLYPGHKPGKKEAQAVENYLAMLNQKYFTCLKYQFINQINDPPFLLAIQKN